MTDSADAASAVDDLFLDDDRLTHAYEVYKLLREQRPVLRVTVPPGIRAWLVTRHRDVRAALVDPRLSKNRASIVRLLGRHSVGEQIQALVAESFAEHLLFCDPPDHTRLRRLIGSAFTTHSIAQLRPRVEQIARELLDAIEAGAVDTGGEIDLADGFAFPLPIAVISELLGIPLDRRDEFRRLGDTIGSNEPPPLRRSAADMMNAAIRDLLDDKRRHPGPDMLSMIVAAEGADRLSEREAASMAVLLMLAGYETTASLISNGVLALVQHPDQLAALRNDPSLTPKAVEELLRYTSPINMATLRYTTEPITISGTMIPANEFVLVALASANRDPEQYLEADQLDIRREQGNLAFGHGIHHCVGAPLARLEGEIALNALLARFPHMTLARDPKDLNWRSTAVLRSLTELPIRIDG